jgi:hypothetical protein
MKNNIFLKSVLRQPIRIFILCLLIAAAAFALVARVTEFIIVGNEIRRIEGHYRSIGILSPIFFDNITEDHDVAQAAELIEGSRHVAFSDARSFTQGVLSDYINFVTQIPASPNYFVPFLHGLDIDVMDHFFIGRLFLEPFLIGPFSEDPYIRVSVNVDELILGDPQTLRTGTRVFTNEWGQTATLHSRHHMHLTVTKEEAELFREGLWDPLGGLELDVPALFRASGIISMTELGRVQAWQLRPLYGEDGLRTIPVTVEEGWVVHFDRPDPRLRSPHTELLFSVAETEAYTIPNLDMRTQNLSTVTVIETRDMTAIPRFTTTRTARLLDTSLFPAGRWLDHRDYLEGNRVAVVPAQFAIRRGLRIGDIFTMTLRDNPRPGWIDQPTESTWARGIESWWDNHPAGWWPMLDNANAGHWRDFPTYELELEVVGLYQFFPLFFHNFSLSEIYIPAGLIPEGFGWDDAPQLTGMYSFVLNSPRSEEAFLNQTREALAELGFVASFIPNDFEHLAAATDPIRASINTNAIIFGAVSVLVLALVVFLYVRQWRKAAAISRALGMPQDTVLRWFFAPVALIWIPAVVIGGVFAWFYALGQAENTLTVITQYATEVLPGLYWLVVQVGGIILFILFGVWAGASVVIRRPVLVQLQGDGKKTRKVKAVPPDTLPDDFDVTRITVSPVSFTFNARSALRASLVHSLRHIARSPVKTLLAAVVAMFFVFSLGWLNHTIQFNESEIERLWDTTIIQAEIVRDREGDDSPIWWQAEIAPLIWDLVRLTGFVRDYYLESFANDEGFISLGASHMAGFIAENTRTLLDEQLGIFCDDIEIHYVDGYGEDDFVYGEDSVFIPLVVRRRMVEEGGWVAGAYYSFHGRAAKIIAVLDGGMARGINRFGEEMDILVMPEEALRAVYSFRQPFSGEWSFRTGRPIYMTLRFTVDPARNREIERLRHDLEVPLINNEITYLGALPLVLVMDDDVLHQVILSLEQNLSLLRVLYPIAVGAAFVLAFGLSLLIMMQSVYHMAIMRVLGKGKAAARTALCIEQMIVCVFGILLGLAAMPVFGVALGNVTLLLAAVYFAGAFMGTVTGVTAIGAKAPLELLQVRE